MARRVGWLDAKLLTGVAGRVGLGDRVGGQVVDQVVDLHDLPDRELAHFAFSFLFQNTRKYGITSEHRWI